MICATAPAYAWCMPTPRRPLPLAIQPDPHRSPDARPMRGTAHRHTRVFEALPLRHLASPLPVPLERGRFDAVSSPPIPPSPVTDLDWSAARAQALGHDAVA